MGMFPDPKPSDLEVSLWNYDLFDQGKVMTLDQLNTQFGSANNPVKVVKEDEKYIVYGVNKPQSSQTERIAYKCKKCNNIVIGPPEFVDENSLNDQKSLTGREGYDLYCRVCDFLLERNTFRQS